MNEQQIKQLQFFSQTHRAIHGQRIKLELTVLIGVLTFYVLTPRFVRDLDLHFSSWWLPTLFLLLTAVLAVTYFSLNAAANEFNQGVAQRAEALMRENLAANEIVVYLPPLESRAIVLPRARNPNRNRWLWGYITPVLLFFIGSAFITHQVLSENTRKRERTVQAESRSQNLEKEIAQLKEKVERLNLETTQHTQQIDLLKRRFPQQRTKEAASTSAP